MIKLNYFKFNSYKISTIQGNSLFFRFRGERSISLSSFNLINHNLHYSYGKSVHIQSFSTSSTQFNFLINTDNSVNLNQDNKLLLKQDPEVNSLLKNGFKGYKNITLLGQLENLIEVDNLTPKLIEHLNTLDKKITYTMLFVIRWYNSDTGKYESVSTGKSIKLTHLTDPDLLANKIIFEIQSSLNKYSIEDFDSELMIISREWLSINEFKEKMSTVNKEIEKIIRDSLPKDKDDAEMIKKRVNLHQQGKYENFVMNNYGTLINNENNKNKDILYYKISDNECLEVTKLSDSSNKVAVRKRVLGEIIIPATKEETELIM